jgi:hypothetical protein
MFYDLEGPCTWNVALTFKNTMVASKEKNLT